MWRSSLIVVAGLLACVSSALAADPDTTRLSDTSDGRDWAAFGRTFGEQHYSPLSKINAGNIKKLGLAWSLDLPPGNTVTGPLAIDGILYIATGYSIVRAIDAASGKPLWVYDPKAAAASGVKLRQGWGIRGLAYWNAKLYVGTQDGRLIAIDAKTGTPVWSAMTVEKEDYRFISGPPRVFDGKVIIGHAGADAGDTRGYVTTYDAEKGKQLWRFWTVPGDPSKGFENPAMEMAAKTWAGEWWKRGGGGTVWNAMTYDAEFDTIYLGTGNGAPWNHKIRSQGKGDNLFLCSIVALDAKTGAYKWHYQFNPGETWDWNAAMDMELADLTIDGKPRKVVMTAPKNGFFYVIDRANGKLISAEKIAKMVTWATRIDLATGRPVEVPEARFPNGTSFVVAPSSYGAHSWMPMAFSPKTGLAYVPLSEMSMEMDDKGVDLKNWVRPGGNAIVGGVNLKQPPGSSGALVAWNPVTQKEAWRVPLPIYWTGGIMATGGNLVFQGRVEGSFDAYDAKTGEQVWSFAAQAPVLAPPISYSVGGKQYVTVLSGADTAGSVLGPLSKQFNIDYRTQARRVLTFALGGTATLPKSANEPIVAVEDPDYKPNKKLAHQGEEIYGLHCVLCHGQEAIAAGHAPDLRASPIPLSPEAFSSIVHDGSLIEQGMPHFHEMSPADLAALRQYIRAKAAELRGPTQ